LSPDGKRILIVIDTAPSYSEVQTAAIVAADFILCPMTPSYGSELGMYSVQNWLKDLPANGKKGFAILPQMFDPEDVSHLRLLRSIHQAGTVYPAIPFSTQLAKNLDVSMPIWTSRTLTTTPLAARYAEALEHLAKDLKFQLKFKTEEQN
jgi:cellulose biosynthesis protein BcsQ